MRLNIRSIAVGVWMIIIVNSIQIGSATRELPCDFNDSIDITDGEIQPNKSFIFYGITFSEDQYAYVREAETDRTYPRGCPCEMKPCIRLFCGYGMISTLIGDQEKCQIHEGVKQFQKDILTNDSNPKSLSVNYDFVYVIGNSQFPCRDKSYESDFYTVTNEGKLVNGDGDTMEHHDYYLLTMLNNETNQLINKMIVCYSEEDQPDESEITYANLMLISVPFLVATILVYICIPELRNLHGKCLLFYLTWLSVSYLSLGCVKLNGHGFVEPFICKSVGYIIYFSFMSAFLWLGVISFDLWWIFRSTQGVLVISEKKRFLIYVLYTCGFSSFFTFVVFIVDSSSSIPYEFQPGIGNSTCFLKDERQSKFLYFYLVETIICIINSIFFILTAFRIRMAQQELKRVTSQDGSKHHRRKFNKNKDRFILYLRLFIVMGVTWIMEGVSFLIDNQLLLTDAVNCIQGVIIFMLFVLKPRVFRLIQKRWRECLGKATITDSTPMTSTSRANAPSTTTNVKNRRI